MALAIPAPKLSHRALLVEAAGLHVAVRPYMSRRGHSSWSVLRSDVRRSRPLDECVLSGSEPVVPWVERTSGGTALEVGPDPATVQHRVEAAQ